MTTTGSIAVGVDGSEASVAALELALHEAQLRGTTVLAITCWPATDRGDSSGPLLCGTFEQATELLEHVLTDTHRRHPHHVPVIREIAQNLAGPALVAASRHAELVVVGSTTRGPRGHRHGRRTIEHCLLYAESPVVVVPWPAGSLDGAQVGADRRQESPTS